MSSAPTVSRTEFEELKAKVNSLSSGSGSGSAVEKQPRKPREPSEYNKFIGVKCKEIKLQNPELKQSDVLKLAAGKWKNEKTQKASEVSAIKN